jgi:small subunit ribosomal protein S6
MGRHYELTLIVDSQSGEEAVNQTVGKYEAFLNDNGASPVVADRRGVRKLAYEIKKMAQADYTYVQFTAEAPMVLEMDRQLRLDQSVLRHLFIKIDEAPVVPSEEPAEEASSESNEEGTEASGDAKEGDE